MKSKTIWKFAVLPFVVGVGIRLMALRWAQTLPDIGYGLLVALSEALMIAGILAVVVDSQVKRELLKEVSRGLFEHMIGFDHKPAIKERIKDIAFNTAVYREDYTVEVTIIPIDLHETRLDMSIRTTVINESPVNQNYRHHMTFNEYEHGVVTQMSITSNGDPSVNSSDWKVEQNEEEKRRRATTFALNKNVQLKPQVKYDCFIAYSVTVPRDHFFNLNMAYPTLGIMLRIDKPNECDVYPDPPTAQTGITWIYDKLYMQGEHVTINWKFKS
jgi:hypothetical protein